MLNPHLEVHHSLALLLPLSGKAALDVPATHLSPVHCLDGSLSLGRSGEGDEGKALARVVDVRQCAVALEGSAQIFL